MCIYIYIYIKYNKYYNIIYIKIYNIIYQALVDPRWSPFIGNGLNHIRFGRHWGRGWNNSSGSNRAFSWGGSRWNCTMAWPWCSSAACSWGSSAACSWGSSGACSWGSSGARCRGSRGVNCSSRWGIRRLGAGSRDLAGAGDKAGSRNRSSSADGGGRDADGDLVASIRWEAISLQLGYKARVLGVLKKLPHLLILLSLELNVMVLNAALAISTNLSVKREDTILYYLFFWGGGEYLWKQFKPYTTIQKMCGHLDFLKEINSFIQQGLKLIKKIFILLERISISNKCCSFELYIHQQILKMQKHCIKRYNHFQHEIL